MKQKEMRKTHPHLHRIKKRISEDRKLNLIFRKKYPKLFSLVLIIILSYIIFSSPTITDKINFLDSPSYPFLILMGVLLGFGFTAPIATGFLISANFDSLIIPSIIISLGSLVADITIFKFVKFSFLDEFNTLEHTKIMKEINEMMNLGFIHKIKIYIFYSFVGILIASPLPDEIGVSLLAGLTKINIKTMIFLSFVLHVLGTMFIISL